MGIKVCHVTSVHPRYDTRIFHKECTSLAKAGYDVTLLVADNKAPEVRNGVKIISADFKPKSRMDRIMHSAKVMLVDALKIDAEIYHIHDPELLPVAKKLKQHGKKVIFDSHEDVPAQILNKHWIPAPLRKPCSWAYSIYANSILRELDYIIGVTPHLVEKLRSINPRVEMITNFPIVDSIGEYISLHKTDKKKTNVIVFAGGVTEQWSHEQILEAIEGLDVEYKLAGPSTTQYIDTLKQYPSWKQVDYLGRIPHEKVPELFVTSAVGMAILQYSPNSDSKHGTLGNTKLFEYMIAGLPVICTDFELWEEIIDKWHCGICVNPKDVKAIGRAINYLVQNPQIAGVMGSNGKCAVHQEYNWGMEEKKLIATYSKVFENTLRCVDR